MSSALCGEKKRGKQASERLWMGTDPRAKHHSADAATSLGDLPHEDALGRGEIMSDGEMLRISQETLPEGKP